MFETHPSNCTVSLDKKLLLNDDNLSPCRCVMNATQTTVQNFYALKHPCVMRTVQGNYFKVTENGYFIFF